VIVYVETNFLLELALDREQAHSCRQLLDWSHDNWIEMRVPVYALAEGQSALVGLRTGRLKVIESLRSQARDLARMTRSETLARMCKEAAEALSASNEVDHASLNEVMREVGGTASFIPLSKAAVELAEIVRRQGAVKGHGDLMIFASILEDLSERGWTGTPDSALFVTRDQDFGDDASQWIRGYACELLNSYDAAVARLKGTIE